MVQWFEKGGLHESPADESEIDFGFRVLEHMAKSLTIGRKNKGLSVRQVMASKTCTCHGCNSVFVASMRRKGIAARVKHGQKLKKENVKASAEPEFEGGWAGSRPPDKHNGHSKSEFYASGLGYAEPPHHSSHALSSTLLLTRALTFPLTLTLTLFHTHALSRTRTPDSAKPFHSLLLPLLSLFTA